LFEAMWSYLEPFRNRRKELEKDPGYVQSVLRKSAERARAEARKTLNAARCAMGLD
jgi:tryptophanyl-tRNA synthetase